MSDPEGCFVLRDKNKILGYNYSKTMGKEIFRTLRIMENYQNGG